MRRPIQDPVEKPGGRSDSILTHPAFGQIAIHHVSGSADLYGSDFSHQNYVTITIKASELHRSLYHDFHFERETLFEVALSEAQFATFVAAPNRSGVPCTILCRNDGGRMIDVPGLPRRDSTHMYNKEVVTKMTAVLASLREQRAIMEAATAKIAKKTQAELLEPINTAIREIESNLPFIVESFERHMETNIEKAKVEVNAYVTNTIARAGLKALQEGEEFIALNKPEKDD